MNIKLDFELLTSSFLLAKVQRILVAKGVVAAVEDDLLV
jgi:hypothetical protein